MRAGDAGQRALAEGQSVDIGAHGAEHPRPLDRVCAQWMRVSARWPKPGASTSALMKQSPRPLDRVCAQWMRVSARWPKPGASTSALVKQSTRVGWTGCAQWMLVSALAEGQRADVGLGAWLS